MNGGFDGLEAADLGEALSRSELALRALDGASIFITGGTGLFGTWLVALLAHARQRLNLDLQITILSRDPRRFAEAWPDLAALDCLQLVRGDVRFFEFPKGRYTHVIHAATDTSAAADRDPATLIDSIAEGTKRVLEFAGAAGVKRLLYVSSGAVYGRQPDDVDRIPETFPGAPDPLDRKSAYGQAKRLAEQMCICASAGAGFEPVIARGFAFVGPGLPLDGHFAIGNFICDAMAGRDIVVSGDGTPRRSYLYMGDLAAWLVTMLVSGRAGSAYNVGSDETISIADLARAVAATIPGPGAVAIRGAAAPGAPRSRYVPSIDKARAELALEAWTPLEEAIRRTAAFAQLKAASPKSASAAHRNEHGKGEKLTFVVDVDGVVASLVSDNDYRKAEPLADAIEAINRLHAQGHRIVMFTARGSATGIDWSATTRAQFERWGLRYHELHFGKPAADFYIDDRLLSIAALKTMAQNAG